MQTVGKYRRLMVVAALAAIFPLSACVSDTLSEQNTQQQLASPNNASFDPAQREAAIQEIRAKAAQPGSGELTNAYSDGDGPNEPLTPEEQAAKIARLEGNAAANSESVTDAELSSKQQSIRNLQSRARSHYNRTVNSITN